MRSVRATPDGSPSTVTSLPCVRMRTPNSASSCFRFSSYVPNSASSPSSGTAIFFIGRTPERHVTPSTSRMHHEFYPTASGAQPRRSRSLPPATSSAGPRRSSADRRTQSGGDATSLTGLRALRLQPPAPSRQPPVQPSSVYVAVVFSLSSRSCLSSTGDGAPDMRSTACAVFGNAMTSRIELSPARMATVRSSPSAMPAVRRRAVLERVDEEAEAQPRLLVADVQQPEDPALDGRSRGCGCCRRRSRCRSAPGRRPSRARCPDRSRAPRSPRRAAT